MNATIMKRALWIFCAIGSLSLLLTAPCAASAASEGASPAASATDGVITIDYTVESTPVAQAGIDLYRVADIAETGGFTPSAPYAGYGLDWSADGDDATFWRAFAETLAGYVARDALAPDAHATTDTYGHAAFEGLARGLYLVTTASQTIGGRNCTFGAMLASLPATVGEHGMRVALEPKADCTATPDELTVRKIWRQDDASRRPDSVTVELLADGRTADRVTLDASRGWTHTWNNLEPGHEYRVVEADVPEGYGVLIDREGGEVDIVNTATTSDEPPLPNTGAALVPVLSIAAACAVVGVVILMLAHAKDHEGAHHGGQ